MKRLPSCQKLSSIDPSTPFAACCRHFQPVRFPDSRLRPTLRERQLPHASLLPPPFTPPTNTAYRPPYVARRFSPSMALWQSPSPACRGGRR